jgi:hypothetical protein
MYPKSADIMQSTAFAKRSELNEAEASANYVAAMKQLVVVVQQLSLARNLSQIMEIVRCAARDLTQADGATFVLRDEDRCYYAEENAISPLWKGLRFPMDDCISGSRPLSKTSSVIRAYP